MTTCHQARCVCVKQCPNLNRLRTSLGITLTPATAPSASAMPPWLSSSRGLRPYLRAHASVRRTAPPQKQVCGCCAERQAKSLQHRKSCLVQSPNKRPFTRPKPQPPGTSLLQRRSQQQVRAQCAPTCRRNIRSWQHCWGPAMQNKQCRTRLSEAHLSTAEAAAMVKSRLTPPVMMEATMGDCSPAVANT